MKRSLTWDEVEAMPNGARVVVTWAGRVPGARVTGIYELRKIRAGLGAFENGVLRGMLRPGDGLDDDFVAVCEDATERKEDR